jgi:hypothetical protein
MAAILARGATPTMPRPLSAAAAALAHLWSKLVIRTPLQGTGGWQPAGRSSLLHKWQSSLKRSLAEQHQRCVDMPVPVLAHSTVHPAA